MFVISILLFPCLIFGSAQLEKKNRFIAVIDKQTNNPQQKDYLTIPSFLSNNVPGTVQGLPESKIEELQTNCNNKTCQIYFETVTSIGYFLQHIVKISVNSELYKQYLEIARTCKMNFTHVDDDNRPKLLLQAMEHASNNVSIDKKEEFQKLTLKTFYELNSKEIINLTEETTSKNPSLKPSWTKEKGTAEEGHWNRLKKAYRFFWDTFNRSAKDFTPKQHQELKDNKFYIRIVEAAFFVPFITCCFFTFYLTQVFCNKLKDYTKRRLEDILNKK